MTENPTQSVPPQSTSFLDDSFARLRHSGYQRDTDNRWFGGVCSGLARRFGVDPVLIRAAAVVLAFVGGIGLTVYVILWLLLPDQRGDILGERAVRQGDAGPIALLVLAAFLVLGGLFSIGNGNGWFAPLWLIPVAAIGWFVLARRGTSTPRSGYGAPTSGYGAPQPVPGGPQAGAGAPQAGRPAPTTPYVTPPPPPSGEAMSTPTQAPPYAGVQPGPYRGPQPGTYGGPPLTAHHGQSLQSGPYGGQPTPPVPPRPIAPPPPPRPRRRRPSSFVGLVSLGIALVGMGLGAALDDPLGFPGSSATLGFLIALTGVSVVVLTLGIKGRASGFSGFLTVVLSLLLVTSAAVSRIDVQDGVGERTWTPVPATGTTSFELGAGDATLDLSRLLTADGAATTTPQRIDVEMGVGGLTILVPEGLDARVDANVGIGSIRHSGGTVTDVNESSGTDRTTSTTFGDEPVQVVVDAELGIGEINIQEQ